MKVSEVRKALERGGWRVVRRRGSHVQYRHPDNPNVVTLAGHDGDDITPGQLSDIRRKTRLPLR